jgi:hypothetical protein
LSVRIGRTNDKWVFNGLRFLVAFFRKASRPDPWSLHCFFIL